MERVNVGLVGFGTVGGAFYRLMQANGGLFQSKFGVAAGITAVAEKDPGKVQAAFPGQKVVPDYRALTADPVHRRDRGAGGRHGSGLRGDPRRPGSAAST